MVPAGNLSSFLVGRRGENYVLRILKPELTRDEALTLAAWIVATDFGARQDFNDVLEAVENT